MNLFQRLVGNLQEKLRVVITNSDNFEVKWTVTSSRFRLYSVVFLLILICGICISFLISFLNSKFESKNNLTIERQKLEIQFQKINQLSRELDLQTSYINRVKQVISGNLPVDSFQVNVPKNQKDILSQLDGELSESEIALESKVKADIEAIDTKKNIKKILRFEIPVNGEIINKFRYKKHPFLEIKTTLNEKIIACNSGVVLFSSGSKSESFSIIIKHDNGFVSIYKNLKFVTKKSGTKIKKGEVIGVIFSKKNQQTFPLHFELWYEQSPVNPEEYIKW
jgi:murein DD-endopeptidase MepM/ murein hydrolase activator NlpD